MESVQDAPDQTGAVKVELGTGETPDWSVCTSTKRTASAVWSSPIRASTRGTRHSGQFWRLTRAGGEESTVNRPSAGWIVCLLLCGMLIAGVFYLIGYKAAYDRMENTVPSRWRSQLHGRR